MSKNNNVNTLLVGDPDKMDLFNDERVKTQNDHLMYDVVKNLDFQTPNPGTILKGTFVGTTAKEILLDVGFKDFIRIENKGEEVSVAQHLEVGDQINVAILKVEEFPEYTIKGSISVIAKKEAREILKTKMSNDVYVNALIKEMNPAGYILEFIESNIKLTGFMPNTIAGSNRIKDPESIVGERMEVMIESFSKDKGTYILSRKRFLEGMAKQAINELEVGEIDIPYVGTVTGSTSYGVFVQLNDFGGSLTGMIHEANFNKEALDELGIDGIQNIPDGTEIECFIKEVLPKNNRIILTQIFRPSIWDTVVVGDVLEGTVRSIKPFGTLVKLDEETQGLIRSFETKKNSKNLEVKDVVHVKITSMNKGERKIYLSIV